MSPARRMLEGRIDGCVAKGDIDGAVEAAKKLAYVNGSTMRTVGMTALILLVASVERVTGAK